MLRPRDPVLALIRAVLIILGALVGLGLAGRLFPDPESQTSVAALGAVIPVSTAYLTLLGGLVASLATKGLSVRVRDLVARFAQATVSLAPETALAATVATILALLVSVLLNNILRDVPGFAWYHSLALTLALEILLVAVAVGNRRHFMPFSADQSTSTPGRARPFSAGGPRPKLLDSSVIIDGRVLEVARAGYLEGPLIVPGFVLREVQFLADQNDPTRRAKGRRGLEVLERMQELGLNLVVREFPDEAGGVDDRLVRAAVEGSAALVTNDSALGKVASLHGVRALNLNELAEALRPSHGAGDELTITVVKEGSKPGQGVGYLADGTMVVIEDGLALRGRVIKAAVISSSQTALGRMIFAKLKEVL